MHTKIVSLLALLLFICNVKTQAQCPTASSITVTGSLCVNNALSFSITGAPVGVTYSWDMLGDGTAIKTGDTVIYTYTTAKNYTLKVTATGCTTTVSKNIAVAALPTPTITVINGNTCSGDTVKFAASGTNLTYTWDFGDAGVAKTGKNVGHIYNAVGDTTQTYTVQLTPKTTGGCVSTISKTVTVIQRPDLALQDQNTSSPFKNCGGTSYTLTLNNSTTNQSSITGYTLNWGDGSPAVALTNVSFPITHTYTTQGLFNLSFSGTNTNNCTATKHYAVANQSSPTVNIQSMVTSGSKICGSSGYWFKMTNYQSNAGGTRYKWDFGDGSPVVAWTPPFITDSIFHVFTSSSCTNGTPFTVSVKAINSCDSVVSSISNISVALKPKASFTMSRTFACVGDTTKANLSTICFTNTTKKALNFPCGDTTTTYLWDFDDPGSASLDTSSLRNPCFKFFGVGYHIVTLIAKGTYCPIGDTAVQTICAAAKPTNNFTLNNPPAGGCAPLIVQTTNLSNALTSCVPTTYLWKVAYNSSGSSGFCGGPTGSDSFSPSADSIAPAITFKLPGLYTVSLQVTNWCGTNSSNTSIQNVIVLAKPSLALTPIPNACGAVSISPSATTSSCTATDYEWSFLGGSPSSYSGQFPPNINFSICGLQTVSLSVSNTCGTTQQSTNFNICQGTSTTFNQSVCSGNVTTVIPFTPSDSTSYTWTATQTSNMVTGYIASGTDSIPAQTLTNTGTTLDSVVYSITPLTGGQAGTTIIYTIYVYPNNASVITALNDESVTDNSNVYPNPNNGTFTVSVSASNLQSGLDIYNFLGQKVYSQPITNLTTVVNLSNAAKGSYFYTLSNQGTVVTKGKLILE